MNLRGFSTDGTAATGDNDGRNIDSLNPFADPYERVLSPSTDVPVAVLVTDDDDHTMLVPSTSIDSRPLPWISQNSFHTSTDLYKPNRKDSLPSHPSAFSPRPSKTDAAPMHGNYADFETIDWVKDMNRNRCRHREIAAGRFSLLGWLKFYYDSGSGWFCVLLVGLVTGLIACVIDIGSTWMSDLKEGVCLDAFWFNRDQCCWSSSEATEECDQWFSWSRLFMNKPATGAHPDAYFVAYLCYTMFAVTFAGLCVLLVRMFAPYACGSGIPEIKTILSGFVIRGYLGKWTLLIKAIGMILGVAAGLSLGKEGPMVHMAACVGNIFAYLFPKYGGNEAKKREILSAAAAAGVAVAFSAPIGGVLFSLEEASYYFPMKTMFRSFFCAMVSANVLRTLTPFGSDHVIMFSVDYKAQWHVMELFPFALLGLLGGLYGTIFNWANLYVCRLRKTTRLGRYAVREVVLVALATALVSFPHPYLRMNSSALIRLLVSRCSPGDDMSICDYKINSTDPIHNVLGTYPTGPRMSTAMILLAFALLVKLVTTVFTFGIKVPTGLFIPSLAAGAIMGRMLGVAVEQLMVANSSHPFVQRMCKSSNPCINPGLYAMVGAAATLGGVTRMTISLVVVMLELTGGLNYIIPLMVAAMVSKWTGDRLTKGSIYEEHIKLNGYPYLGSDSVELEHTYVAADVMQPRPVSEHLTEPQLQGGTTTTPSPALFVVSRSLHQYRPTDHPRMSLYVIVSDGMTVGDLETLLESSSVNGFPVVVSHHSPSLVGWVTRRDLRWALDREKQHDVNITDQSPAIFTNFMPDRLLDDSLRDDAHPICLFNIVDLSPTTVTDQTPMETVVDFFCKLGLRQILVTHNGCILGIVTKKDVLKHLERRSGNLD